MLTTDLSLRVDPAYEKISRRFLENPQAFAEALRARLVQADPPRHGPARPATSVRKCRRKYLLWQDPLPLWIIRCPSAADIAALKARIAGLGPVRLGTGRRGLGLGLDLPRRRQARRRQRCARPPGAAEGLGRQQARRAARPSPELEAIQRSQLRRRAGLAGRRDRSGRRRGRRAGRQGRGRLGDGAVLAGPRRCLGSEQTDVRTSFAGTEPHADGFRNYRQGKCSVPAEALLIDKAQLLTLTAPEMTVLVGGLRAININADGRQARRVHRHAPAR